MAVLSAKAKVSAAANGMRRLVKNLQKVADGSVVDQVLVRVSAQLAGVVRDKTARHRESGFASSNSKVTRDASGIDVSFPKYLDYNAGWWPFAKGLPLFVVRNVASLLRKAVAATIAGDPGGVEYFTGLEALAAERAKKKADARAHHAAKKAEHKAKQKQATEERRAVRVRARAAVKEIRASGRAAARTARTLERRRLRQELAA